jgi:hypothetical protein
MKAISIKGKSPEEIKTALEQCMADARLPDGQVLNQHLPSFPCPLNRIAQLFVKFPETKVLMS